ncbi:MAG: MOSC domain-containing protein [Vicinamibacterales bacterium]
MRTAAELEAGLDEIRHAPADQGTLLLIARRPKPGVREIVTEASLNPDEGVAGDNWKKRGDFRTRGPADPETQVTIMNARAAALVAESEDRWALAGDQLFVDFDLSLENLPAGTLLAIGSAVVRVSATPHTGCKKFVERFGLDAMKFVNSPVGRALNLRGINARVIQAGSIRVGDTVRKCASGTSPQAT